MTFTRNGILSSTLFALVILTITGASHASTRSYGGVVETVGPINEQGVANALPDEPAAIRSFFIRSTFMEYISQTHEQTSGGGQNHRIGLVWRQHVRSRDNACMLNGELMDPFVFAKALRPGLWGHIYEDQWFALSTLPRSRWGAVAGAVEDGRFRLRMHHTHNAYHLAKNPPVDELIAFDADTSFQLEGEPAKPAEALAVGNWVQVHPARKQYVTVRTDQAAFYADTLTHYWQGRRGAVNDLTAPARLRGYRMDDPDDAHAPSVQLEVTRLRRGEVEQTTFRGSFALLLDGRMAPPAIALRPGRAATLVTYRSDRQPHYVFLWSDSDVIRGRIRAVDEDAVTIDLTGRLTGEKTGRQRLVKLNTDAIYQSNGRNTTREEALKIGLKIALYPARGRTICAFAPQHDDRPDFTAGDAVTGTAVGHLSRTIKERLSGGGSGPHHRMLRFDLDLGMPLQGPTRTTHRQLYLTAVTRDGKLHDLVINNYAWHAFAPAWTARIAERNIQYDDGKLSGKLVIDVTPGPKGRESPVQGGRYTFTFGAPVRANCIADQVDMTLDGRDLGKRDLTGRATVLPALISAGPGDAVYTLTLDDPQNRVRPLTLHLEALAGQFVDGVATSGGSSLYPVATSRLQIAGSRIHGPVRLTIPAQHAGLHGIKPLEVQIELDIRRTSGGLTGSFRGRWGIAADKEHTTDGPER